MDFSDHWSSYFGIDKLSLKFPVRTDGIEGECFQYSVYFKGGADEQKISAVRNAVNTYDFQLVDDDYPGYISISEEDGKACIYLDLGNTAPQNQNTIIGGILLAVNNIPDIEKVIINEGLDEIYG